MSEGGLDPSEIAKIKVELDTDKIKRWRSIVTLIVFVVTSKFGSPESSYVLDLAEPSG